MKMRTFFYKKIPLFNKKMPIVIYKKNLMLQIVIYKKLNFSEEYTPLTVSNCIHCHHCQIVNIVKNDNIVYIRHLVNIAKIATIVNIVKSVNSVNSVLKIVGKSVHEPETFFLRTDKEIGEKRKFILFDPLLGNEERYWDGP